jgi:cathepsin L
MLPDHLVQMVGYGTATAEEGGGDYFLIRNSWTPLWGEDGYIRLARSATPSCGTDVTPLDGNGCTGGPPTVEVCGQSGVLYDGVYPTVVQ